MQQARLDRIDTVLGDVHCPLLVIRGAHDHISPADWAARLTRVSASRSGGAPAWESVTLAEGAHMVPYTHGAVVADAAGDFLTHVLSTGRPSAPGR
jgi:fermentation-respiration switch protein FrsA (DUF1100 family)